MSHYTYMPDYDLDVKKAARQYKKEVEKAKNWLILLIQELPEGSPKRIFDSLDSVNDWLITQAARK